mmetsp:Transcript_14309/g.21023  ORF Transcript_14309/g.21023 Transcript_14309/m.21023 type:complete len:84 (+) Transcript_14309:1009-1260(+)
MCPDIVAVEKDEEEKLEAPSSVSHLLDRIGGAGCFALLCGFVFKGGTWASAMPFVMLSIFIQAGKQKSRVRREVLWRLKNKAR